MVQPNRKLLLGQWHERTDICRWVFGHSLQPTDIGERGSLVATLLATGFGVLGGCLLSVAWPVSCLVLVSHCVYF